MIHKFSRLLMTLVALFAMTTGAWALPAQNYLYLEVDGTSATVKYGADKGTKPYYGEDPMDPGCYGWWKDGSSYDGKNTLTTVTIDASCQNYTGTTLVGFFESWSGLTTINNLKNLNTSEVTNMSSMFNACSSMTSFDLSGLNTAKVTNMDYMFGSVSVETLDLSSFNTSSVTNMYSMFNYSSNLKTIYVGDGWSTASVTGGDDMFGNCMNLPGFDWDKTSHEMAKLTTDGGYLTYKAPPITVTWDAATKTGTFDMPASDVVLTPIYAPVAQWATESDVELLPTAAEGVIAGTDAPLIVEGTVAPGQGIVMYAVTSTNQATAPELSAFSATVPTAENIADEGADVLVWYYIQGADTPDGQEATAENTFNDSEICATPLEVSVLSNQFDITFNAANANTIENGKATVTVGGTAATVTEGKLEGVKMGSEVKMTAKQGYKFRKVEAKKAAPAEPTPAVGQVIGSDGKNYDYDSLPVGVTAVAKICYVSGDNGLAIAMADEATGLNWETAISTCEAHTPAITGCTWKLPTKDEWNNMITGAGGNNALFGDTDLNLNTGSWKTYWTSTEIEGDASSAWGYSYTNGWNSVTKTKTYALTRACLAW